MALLAEYALTPDVFDSTSYSSGEVCGLHLDVVKDVLLHEGLVRDLRNGDWARVFHDAARPWHIRGRELLKKLAVQRRLIGCAPMIPSAPMSDVEWCNEALASHNASPLAGIVVSKVLSEHYRGNPIVGSIERLRSTSWWKERSAAVRLNRTIADYKSALGVVMRNANSIMFVDPYLNPALPRYKCIGEILQLAAHRSPRPLIEIHVACYEGSGRSRQFLNRCDHEENFRYSLSSLLEAADLKLDVFAWDGFHDRYLITDLVGIGLSNGFDVSSARGSKTVWTRLGRAVRDDIQREFDPKSHERSLRWRFTIP